MSGTGVALMVEPVYTLESALLVKDIRNKIRNNMTRDTRYITEEDQIRWFTAHLSTLNELYLYRTRPTQGYYDTSGGEPVGYGFLLVEEGKSRNPKDRVVWGTLAVDPRFHGLGIGTAIYKHLILRAKLLGASGLSVEIWSDNNASLIAALRAGLIFQYANDKTIVLSGG